MVGSSLNFGMVIPPAQAQWSATGHCPAGCLVEGMPESGIKVYQILPHAHIIGTLFLSEFCGIGWSLFGVCVCLVSRGERG